MNSLFIDEKQQERNLNHAYNELDRCRSEKHLAQLSNAIITRQKGENGNHYFPPGKSKEFWDKYKEKKLQLTAQLNKEPVAA